MALLVTNTGLQIIVACGHIFFLCNCDISQLVLECLVTSPCCSIPLLGAIIQIVYIYP